MSFLSFQRGKAARESLSKSISKWETIITAIHAIQYGKAITHFCNATEGTKRHFNEVVIRKVRYELKKILDLPADTFSLVGAVTNVQDKETVMIETNVKLKPQLGSALAVLLHARVPQNVAFFKLFSPFESGEADSKGKP